jgi:hypothetical protein
MLYRNYSIKIFYCVVSIQTFGRMTDEEIECFRITPNDTKKRYEYVYSTRKVFEYIPLLRRKDWHHYTTNAYQYAGKWLRSCSTGFGDGADYWEVFLLDDGTENIVSWDYNATLCFRECMYYK